jgi:hypothetical protein
MIYGGLWGEFLNIRNFNDPALIHRQNVIHWIARPRRRGSRRGACGCALRAPASDSVGRSCDWEPSAIRLRRWSKKHRISKTMGKMGKSRECWKGEIFIITCIYEPTVYKYIYIWSRIIVNVGTFIYRCSYPCVYLFVYLSMYLSMYWWEHVWFNGNNWDFTGCGRDVEQQASKPGACHIYTTASTPCDALGKPVCLC